MKKIYSSIFIDILRQKIYNNVMGELFKLLDPSHDNMDDNEIVNEFKECLNIDLSDATDMTKSRFVGYFSHYLTISLGIVSSKMIEEFIKQRIFYVTIKSRNDDVINQIIERFNDETRKTLEQILEENRFSDSSINNLFFPTINVTGLN